MLAGLLQSLQQIQPSFWLGLAIISAALALLCIWWVRNHNEFRWWVIFGLLLTLGLFSLTAGFAPFFFFESALNLFVTLGVIGGAAVGATNALSDIVANTRKPEPPPPPPHPETPPTSILPPLTEQVLENFAPTPRAETYISRGKIEQEVRDRLNARGLAAIVGVTAPGGTGKTELALRASQELEMTTGLKRLWLDVGKKSLAEIVADMALGVEATFGPTDTTDTKLRQIHSQLKDKPRLVVFDDVRAENVSDLQKLLPPRPPNAVLITSRIKQLDGVPTTGTFELDALTPDQAIELLKAELGPEVVEAERSVAEDLAKRVAYNALALDIAARRINLLGQVSQPIHLFFNSLKSLQDLVIATSENDAGRLNLFAVLGLSYESLSNADRRRLRWLAAFTPSGFSPAAAAQVWGDDEATASRALTRLLNLNLLKVVPAPQLRYRLHDLIDEYAADKLKAENQTEAARTAHAQWLIALFEEHVMNDLSNAPEVALELDNLRYSTQWAMTLPKGDLLADLATKPRNWLYNIFRINEEWLGWLKKALQLEVEERGRKATVLQAIGDVQAFRKENDAALTSYQQALDLFQAVGDRLGQANVLQAIGDVQAFRKENDAALTSYQQALDLFQAVGDRLGQANTLQSLGKFQMQTGKVEEGLKTLQTAHELHEAIGNLVGQFNIQVFLGQLLAQNGQLEAAISMLQEADELLGRIDARHPVRAQLQQFIAQIQTQLDSSSQTPPNNP